MSDTVKILATCVFLGSWMASLFVVGHVAEKDTRRQAIEAGVGHYVIDSQTGVKSFEWIAREDVKCKRADPSSHHASEPTPPSDH